ncbi:MAG: CBS domain-containing protein [Bacteroidota bacterium]
MMVSFFVRRDFLTIHAYSGTQAVKSSLLKHSALVVQDEDMNTLGVLTLTDILHRQHNLVIDCLTAKPSISPDCDVETTLQVMEREQAEVLPVYRQEQFLGLVFKQDLIKFITEQKKELETQVAERTRDIERQNELLRQISWMQSHQTRQPVATILGLINIIDRSTLTENNLEIIGLLEKTTEKLDTVIRTTVIKASSGSDRASPLSPAD